MSNWLIRALMPLLAAVSLTNCSTNDIPRIKQAKSCVIASEFQGQVDLIRPGATVAGNKRNRVTWPGLGSTFNRILREEVGSTMKVNDVVALRHTESAHQAEAQAVELARQTGSELVIELHQCDTLPQGVPLRLSMELKATGVGVWSSKMFDTINSSAAIGSYLTIREGESGKVIGSALPSVLTFEDLFKQDPANRFIGNNRVIKLAGSWDGLSHTTLNPGQRKAVEQGIHAAFRRKISGYVANWR